MIDIRFSNRNNMGENTYLLTDQSTGMLALVDPGCFPEEMKRLADAGGGISWILLTHGHADHTLFVPEVHSLYPDAKIVAHFDEQELLLDAKKNGSANMYGVDIEFDADTYVIDGETLMLGETELTFLATPGHTRGGMCILAGDVLLSGDTLFRGSIGRTDLFGGSFETLEQSIRSKLYTLPDETKVFPGHGPMTTIGYEKRANPFV